MKDLNDQVFVNPRTKSDKTEGSNASKQPGASSTSKKSSTKSERKRKRREGLKQAADSFGKMYKQQLKNELLTMYALGDAAFSLIPGGRSTVDVINKHVKAKNIDLITPNKELFNMYAGLGKAIFNHPEWWGGVTNTMNGTPIRQITAGSGSYKTVSVTTIQWEYSSLSSIYEGQIDSLIGAYASQRGYASTLTGHKVMTYLHDSFDLLTLLFAGLRAQNAKRARSVDGRNISGALTSTTSVQFAGLDKTDANCGIPSSGVTGAITAWGVETISNAQWAQDYLSILNRTFASREALDFASYLFSNYFQSNALSGDNDLIAVYPTDAFLGINLQDFPTAYAAQVLALENAITADPDLIPVLRMLGFQTVIEFDPELSLFRRDLSGNNYKIVYDPGFTVALKNMVYNYNLTEFTIDNYFKFSVDLDIPGMSLANDLENIGIPIGVLGSAWKFRDCIPLETHFLGDDGSLTGPYILMPTTVFVNGTNFPTNQAIIGKSNWDYVKALSNNPMFSGFALRIIWNAGDETYGLVYSASSSRYAAAGSANEYNRIRSMAYENLMLNAPVVGEVLKQIASLSSAQFQLH